MSDHSPLVVFDRHGGGRLFARVDEITVGSTFTTNKGTEAEPESEIHEGQTGIFIRSLALNVVVDHSVDDVVEMIRKAK